MAISIDTVLTHQQLADEVGGTQVLEPLLSKQLEETVTVGDRTKAIREAALSEVLDALRVRVPPINEGDLSDVTQLRRSVLFNALARIYRMSMSIEGDAFYLLWSDYSKRYKAEITALKPLLRGNPIGSVFSIALNRR